MSYSTILKLAPGKPPEDLLELRNSHGSAPVVWNVMCQKYLGAKEFTYGLYDSLDKLWPKYKDLSIPEHHRAVLMMTYDLAYVEKKNFQRAARDIRQFLKDFPPKQGYVNHWSKIAKVYESDPDCEAIGIHQTSVSDNPFEGEWNEENGDYDLIDWGQTYEIYREIDALKSASEA